MAGFPSGYGVTKCKRVEQWNGRRELTEKTWTVSQENLPTLIFYVGIVPYGIYYWTRQEFIGRGDPRYQDMA